MRDVVRGPAGADTAQELLDDRRRRWKIEESFQAAKSGLGLAQDQNRRWTSRHRWTPSRSSPMPSSPPPPLTATIPTRLD
jgi:hypothetical protein